jgi:hypothetical protein
MSDDKSLVAVDYSQLPATSIGNDEGFDKLAKGVDFLARLQLFSKGKAINQGLITPGNWGIPEGDAITDLGKTVDLMPFARRPKAIDLSDKDAIVTNYDMESEEFKRIAAASGQQDSGCMYGPSFLVLERTTGRLLEYFCGTKSTRSEAKKIYPFLRVTEADIAARPALEGTEPHDALPFTVNIKLIDGKWSYHVPVVIRCSTPFTRIPPMEKIIFEMTRFINPSDAGIEKVDEKETGRTRAR